MRSILAAFVLVAALVAVGCGGPGKEKVGDSEGQKQLDTQNSGEELKPAANKIEDEDRE
jgi:hypothetical protein